MSTWIFLAVVILFFAWRFMPTKGVKTISTTQLKTMINDKDKVFIDVRTPVNLKHAM